MGAPTFPTRIEIDKRADDRYNLKWEYDYDLVDVSAVGDPPNSVEPLIRLRRRIVSRWEEYRR